VERFGEFELIAPLAQGGMAELHKARHVPTGHEVVVKRLLPEMEKRDDIVDLFLTEADVGSLLNHEHIVNVLEAGEAEGRYYIAMEFIDGCDAETLLADAWARKVEIPAAIINRIGVDALRGLHHAHTLKSAQGRPLGLVHRDVSPDNIFITRAGVTKMADFGIAKLQSIEGVTHTGLIKGKLSYMSPEQVSGLELDGRSDLFSMALVLYEMFAATRPFAPREGESEVENVLRVRKGKVPPLAREEPELDRGVAKAVDRALRRWRFFRYKTCASFADHLEKAATRAGLLASPEELGTYVSSIGDASSGTWQG
jgi:serine/threonine protein kinase